MKKLLSALLCVMMVVVFMPTMAFADSVENCNSGNGCTTHEAAIGSTHYDTLDEAFSDAVDNDTIILLKDVEVDSVIEVKKNVTLDLNGHVIKNLVENERPLWVSSSKFSVDGKKSGSGMTIPEENVKSYGFIKVLSPSYITLDGGAYTGNTDDGAFIRLFRNDTYNASGSTIIMNNVNMTTNNWFVSSNTLLTDEETTWLKVTGGDYKTDGVGFGIDNIYASPVYFKDVKATAKQGAVIELSGFNATFENCDFNVTQTPASSFYQTAIAVSWGGIATIKSGNYKSTGYGAYVYSSGGTINIEGGTISGGIAAARADVDNSYGTPSVVNILDGNIEGALKTNGNDKAKITASGGTFKVDPSAYVAEGYVTVPADKAGYVCKVVRKSAADNVEPATSAPEAVVPENFTPEVKVEVEKVAESVTVDELNLIATQESQKIDADKAVALTESAKDLGTGITLYVETYLKVEAETYDSAEKTLTLDITPMKKIVASIAGDVEDFQEGVNAKVVQAEEKIEVKTPVQMSIALPDGFVTSDTDEIYVKHEKGGKTYFYDCSIAENAGKFSISFCNPHGFSKFTITKEAPAAMIDGVGYDTLQEAIYNAKDNDCILIKEPNSEDVVVNKEVAFSLQCGDDAQFTGSISAGKGYKLVVDKDSENGDIYKVTKDTTTSGGGYYPTTPTVQNPTIEASEGVTVTKGSTGTTLAITVADGYELVDVTVNGVSKGKVTTLTGLKTGDKVVVTAQKVVTDDAAAQIAEVKSVKLVARTTMSKAKGKKAVKVYWYATDGSDVELDGVEVFRSVKRYSGFGKKPIFTTTKAQYHNTAIEVGTKYYYKVRGYKVIGGEKVYTDWSTKAWRTVK